VDHISVIARAAGSGGAASASGGGASGSLSEEARAFLQRRVASLGLVLGSIFGTFLAFRLVLSLIDATSYGPSVNVWAPTPFLVVATASVFALWLLCRGRPRSLTAIRRIEAVGLELGCTSLAVMAFYVPYPVRPDYIVVMALGLTMVARAVYVPCTARRTVTIGAITGVPLLALLYLVHLHGHDPAHYSSAAVSIVHESPGRWAVRWVIVDSLWWVTFIAICGATSHVIYGLREQVRDARRLGQYTLVEKLGEGGMGAVYRASHSMLRRPAAVKLLPPDRFDAQSLARFEREVQLTAALTHPNTVRVFDYGRTPDGVFYYAMEYLEGANLAEVVAAGGAMPPGRVIHVLDHLAGALVEAHGVGLIHRDIKPANVLLTAQGGLADFVKVVDFGLVKELRDRVSADDATAPAITQANSVTGTPHYMAPESISAPGSVDARTDLYALGAVGYFLLTGRDVFGGNSFEVLGHHLHSRPVPPSERLGAPVPAELERLILSCLEKEPARRPASAHALLAALRAMGDAHAWSDDDARAWWAEHGDRVRARRARATVATGTTIAVDLGERAG